MRHAVLEDACDSSATDISILQDTTRLHIDNKSKATCFIVLVVPAHTLLCVEKFSHSLQETEVVKEADEHVRFAVPQAVPSPVYRNACHGHVSLYVTAKNRRAGKIKHNKTLSGGPCIRFNTVLFLYLFCFIRIMYRATLTFVHPCENRTQKWCPVSLDGKNVF